MKDLSTSHKPLTSLFERPVSADDWERFRLSDEQIDFYKQEGYLAGLQLLTEAQVERLRDELTGLIDSEQQARDLFYEYHSNESADPNKSLFHALGAWRISPAFHDLLWNPAFLMPAAQLLNGPVRFWHDQIFSSRRIMAVSWHGTRTIRIGHERSPWPIYHVG